MIDRKERAVAAEEDKAFDRSRAALELQELREPLEQSYQTGYEFGYAMGYAAAIETLLELAPTKTREMLGEE